MKKTELKAVIDWLADISADSIKGLFYKPKSNRWMATNGYSVIFWSAEGLENASPDERFIPLSKLEEVLNKSSSDVINHNNLMEASEVVNTPLPPFAVAEGAGIPEIVVDPSLLHSIAKMYGEHNRLVRLENIIINGHPALKLTPVDNENTFAYVMGCAEGKIKE